MPSEHLPTAREFFYAHYNEFPAPSVQESLDRELVKRVLPNREMLGLWDEVTTHESTYSNDVSVEIAFRNLCQRPNADMVRTVLRSCFIALHPAPDFRAFVRAHESDYRGHIAFVSLPMVIALHRVALAYAWWECSLTRTADVGMEKEEVEEHAVREAKALSAATATWSDDGELVVRSDEAEEWAVEHFRQPEWIRNTASGVAACALEFIAAHEAAHVLLGHISGSDDYARFLNCHIDHWLAFSKRWRMEAQADFTAVAIQSGVLGPQLPVQWFSAAEPAIIGAGHALTTFGILVGRHYDTDSHPSAYRREGVIDTAAEVSGKANAVGICAQFDKFRRFLEQVSQLGKSSC